MLSAFGSDVSKYALTEVERTVAVINASTFINGKYVFLDLQLQGSAELLPAVSAICADSAFASQSICSCMQKSVGHVCLLPTC